MIKKRFVPFVLILTILTLFLSACSNNNKTSISLLEFPGLKWGMTPEEVKESLNIRDDMIVSESHPHNSLEITVSGLQYFGSGTDNVISRYNTLGDGSYALYNVSLYYPEGTDMAVIRDKLIEIYGPGTDYGYTDYDLDRNTLRSYVQWINLNNKREKKWDTSIEANAKNPNPTEQIEHWWASTGKGSKTFSDEEIEKFVSAFGDNVGTYADRETVMEYLDKAVKATIRCAETSNLNLPSVSFTGKYINFIASVDNYAGK